MKWWCLSDFTKAFLVVQHMWHNKPLLRAQTTLIKLLNNFLVRFCPQVVKTNVGWIIIMPASKSGINSIEYWFRVKEQYILGGNYRGWSLRLS